MSDHDEDKKMLAALKSVSEKLEGDPKEAINYQIKQLEENLGKKFKGNIFQSKICEKRLEAKIFREKNNLKGYERILEIENTAKSKDLIAKKEICYKKLYFLEKERSKAFKSDEEVKYVKTTGIVKFKINKININPVFKVEKIEFVVDTECKMNIKSDFTGEFVIDLANNKEFEIIVLGANGVLISLIFFPCEYLTKHVLFNEELIELQNGNILTQIKFDREQKLIRKNAEIVCVQRFGHSLENYSIMSVFYCCVCNQRANFFVQAYKCYKCKFTCHKQCANFILFNCPCSVAEKEERFVKRYNIPHTLSKKSSYGLKWCGHCGLRIAASKESFICSECDIHLHKDCSVRVFNACGIKYGLRCVMAEFNPPPAIVKKAASLMRIDDFSLVKVLGRGSFGKVMLAKHKSGTVIALKILKKENLVDSNEVTYIEYERRILAFASNSNHPFLMKMIYCFQDSQHIYFGTELLPGGDLFHHAAKGIFTPQQIKLYTCEVLLGLEFLHKNNIIYRDMKLDNILLTADGHVKIADFGLCKDNFGPLDVTHTYCGTADTIAPEVILQGGYTKDADWWSFGVVIYEMYEGEQPFNGATSAEIASEILHNEVKFFKTPEKAKDLILKLLTRDPKQRIGSGKGDGEEIRKHPYFDGIDWDDVYNKRYKPPFNPGESLQSNFDEDFIEEPIHLTPCNSRIEYDRFFTNFK
ncbi:Serine/threonine kinase [Gurleya vavrai]